MDMTDGAQSTGGKLQKDSHKQNIASFLKNKCDSNFQPPPETAKIKRKLENSHLVVVSGFDKEFCLQTSISAIKSKKYDESKGFIVYSPLYWKYIDKKDAKLIVFLHPFGTDKFDSEKGKKMFSIMDNIVESTTAKDTDDVVDVVILTDKSILKEWKLHFSHSMVEDPIVVLKPEPEDNPLHRFKENFASFLKNEYDVSKFQPPPEVMKIKTKIETSHLVVVSGNDKDLYLPTAISAIKSRQYGSLSNCFLIASSNDWNQIDVKDAKVVVFLHPFGKDKFDSEKGKAVFSIMDNIVESTTAKDNDDVVDVVIITDQSILKKWKLHFRHYMVEDPIVVLKPEPEEKEYKGKDWAKCAQEKDVIAAKELLNNDIIPDKEDLQLAFDNFSDNIEGKELLKGLCQKIENHLMKTNESIENVTGCYKYKKGDPDNGKKIIFVMQAPLEQQCEYNFHVIKQHHEQANEEIETMSEYQFHEANECLRINSPGLMKSHSNLTGTSLSTVKLRKRQGPKHTTCIVLYVEAKGYVPFGEDLLPSDLKYNDTVFETEVRECQCAIATNGGPSDKHEDLKIGCRIASSKEPRGGTLGCFIDHPDHGLCAITALHVLFSDEEFKQICEGQLDVKSLITTQCFQPKKPDKFGEVCDVRLFEGDQNKGGMEIAFVKVDESRKPITPSFPDFFSDDGEVPSVDDLLPKEDGELPFIDKVLRQSLRYDPRFVLQNLDKIKINGQVVKYGCTTKLTSGKFYCSGSSCRVIKKEKGKSKITLNNQIQIRDKRRGLSYFDGKFSDFGDSGAMVFLININEELMALGIISCRNYENETTFVTPIWNILKEIKSPFPYQLAELLCK